MGQEMGLRQGREHLLKRGEVEERGEVGKDTS